MLRFNQATCPPRCSGIATVEVTLKKQPPEDGMWNYCGVQLMFVSLPLCTVLYLVLFTPAELFVFLSQHLTKRKWYRWHAGLLPLCTNQATTNGERQENLLFLLFFLYFFFFLFFWHHIESLALELHIRLDHTIAFFARGSCLVSICSWPLSDFTIRGCGGWGTISE